MTRNRQRYAVASFPPRRVVKTTQAIENATSAIANLDGHPMLLAEDIDREDVRAVAITALTFALPHSDLSRIVEQHLRCRENFRRNDDDKIESVGMSCGLPFPDAPEGTTFRAAHIADGIRAAILGDLMGHEL